MAKPVAAIFYSPGVSPTTPAELARYLDVQLAKIASSIGQLAAGHIDVSYVAPDKFKEGDIRLAAGTLEGAHWDPDGTGARKLYQYRLISVGPAAYGWVPV